MHDLWTDGEQMPHTLWTDGEQMPHTAFPFDIQMDRAYRIRMPDEDSGKFRDRANVLQDGTAWSR